MILLGLASLSVGVWLLTRVHTLNGVCGPNAGPVTGGGISASCMNMMASYFLGFALTVLGLITVAIALFAIARRDRYERRTYPAKKIATLQKRDDESLRDVA